MSTTHASARPGPRPSTVRRAALWVAIGGCLLAQPGAAVVIIDTVAWGSNVAGYQLYAATCDNASETTAACGLQAPRPAKSVASNFGTNDPSQTIYAWGSVNSANNSLYVWKNTASAFGYAFGITGISLDTSGPGAVGTIPGNPPSNPPAGDPALGQNQTNQNQGRGILAAWELPIDGIRSTAMARMRVQITQDGAPWFNPAPQTTPSGPKADQLITVNPDTGAPVSNILGWFPPGAASVNTRQTPIDRTFGLPAGIVPDLVAGSQIEVRLYDSAGTPLQPLPTAVVAPLQIGILGVRADLQGQGYDFGDARVGDPSVTSPSLALTNRLDDDGDGYRALDVAVAAATGVFAGAGRTIAELGAGDTSNATYVFNPTTISQLVVEDEILVSSADADTSQADFTLTGRGVGPQASAQWNGLDYSGNEINAIDIDFGTVAVGASTARTLILSNIFGEDLGNLTDLTVNLTWGEGFALSLLGIAVTQGQNQTPIADSSATGLGSRLADAPFQIVFQPTDDRFYDVELFIATDVGAALGVTGVAPNSTYSVRLRGRGTTAPVPIPATLVLLAIGLLGLTAARR